VKLDSNFTHEAQERAYWKSHDGAEHLDWSAAKKARLPNLKPSTKTISLRLPQHLLDSIKVAANARDVPDSTSKSSVSLLLRLVVRLHCLRFRA